MTSKTKNESKNKESSFSVWSDVFLGLGQGFFRFFSDSLMEKTKEKISGVLKKIQKGLVGFFLVISGAVFFLIGLVLILEEYLGLSRSLGYFFIGIIFFSAGFLIIKKK